MKARWLAEFDTAVMRALGNFCAMKSESDPHPQPSSRIVWPSARPGVQRGFLERALFGLGQRRFGDVVIAAGIFAARPKRQFEEARGHFVMLRIGFARMDRDRIVRHVAREGFRPWRGAAPSRSRVRPTR